MFVVAARNLRLSDEMFNFGGCIDEYCKYFQIVPFFLFLFTIFLGYSTTSGYFFDKNELLYVVGAPRELYQGKVLIFKFHKQVYKSLNVLTSIQGKQIGEYFGGSLAAGDVNGDGYDDLIIGAPYRSKEHYNEGRVYVYLGSSKVTVSEAVVHVLFLLLFCKAFLGITEHRSLSGGEICGGTVWFGGDVSW